MSDLLFGQPDLKFVVWHEETELGSFTFDQDEYSEWLPTFSPVTVRHVLQTDEIRKRLKGYRFYGELSFGVASGTLLNELVKLFQALNAGTNYYDRIQFYPSYVDMPGWSFDLFLDDADITTGFLAAIAHKDISIRFESKYLQEHIPLMEELFLTWGNCQLTFEDLTMLYNTLN